MARSLQQAMPTEEVKQKHQNKALEIEGIVVSSTIGYPDQLRETLNQDNVIYLDSQTSIPIVNAYHTPATLGPDRLAAAIGAHAKCPDTDILVIDMGTAITYDYVSRDGTYLGGNIAPGIDMRFKALHDYTAKLPLVSKDGELSYIGTTTETAIRAGVILGVKYEIEGYIREFMSKSGNVSVFLTGGSALHFEDSIKRCIFADEFLVHEGLYAIYQHNKKHI